MQHDDAPLPVVTYRLNSPPDAFMDHVMLTLVGKGPRFLIDAGYKDGAGEVIDWLKESGHADSVEALLLTHHHHDHLGAAAAVCAELNIRALAHPLELELMRESAPSLPLGPLREGERIRAGGVELEPILTPGHSPGHLSFWWEKERVLFGGDNILRTITTWIGPPHGSLIGYLDSLKRVRELNPRLIFSGHGPPVKDPAARIDALLRHRAQREVEVIACLSKGLSTPAQVAECVYGKVSSGRLKMVATMMESHLEKLVLEGKVRAEKDQYFLVSS